MPEQQESSRDAGVRTGTTALWGEQVGNARQNATRVVDALIVAGWRPPAPNAPLDVVDAAAEALREFKISLGPNTVEMIGRGQRQIHLSGGERQTIAAIAALVAFESPRWRQLAKELHDAQQQERVVYRERARLVAVLASLFPSVWAYSDPAEPEWPVVYVNTPQGQCSWHLSPEDVDLFGHVEQVAADDPRARWDGHSTVEKYRRLAKLAGVGDG
jgi:hypothetical protein